MGFGVKVGDEPAAPAVLTKHAQLQSQKPVGSVTTNSSWAWRTKPRDAAHPTPAVSCGSGYSRPTSSK